MPELPNNDLLLSVALGGIALYFCAQTLRVLSLVWRCVAMRAEGLVTWPAKGPSPRLLWLGLGVLAAGLTVVGSITGTSWHRVFSQAIMAFYFLAAPRLLRTMRLGFYQSGIWTEAGFVPYGRISRWSFAELPTILLMLVRRGSGRALHLIVPTGEYGAARKILHQKTRERALTPDASILDLEGS